MNVRKLFVPGVLFSDERAKVPDPHEGPLLALIGSRHQPRTDKKGGGAFSLVRYKPGTSRGKKNVVEVTALVFDYDHITRQQANHLRDLLKGRAYVLYSSFSHRGGGDDDNCLRVILFMARPLTPAEFAKVWPIVDADLGALADPQAKDESRIWYLPSCPPDRMSFARFDIRDGAVLDVDAILVRVPPVQPRESRKRRTREGGAPVDGAIPQGRRNDTLFRLACAMRRQGADQGAILAALHEQNAGRCSPPLDGSEVVSIAESAATRDTRSPLISSNCTDAGNAERFVHCFGSDFLYTHVHKCWYFWDGRRFRRDSSGHILRCALSTIRRAAADAENVADEKERDRLMAWALESESAARLNAQIAVATAKLPVALEDLDAALHLLNCENGTVELETGVIRPHARADRMTRLAPVSFDPNATCPRWDAFLHRVTGGSERLVGFLQRAVGYSLTASTKDQVLFLLYGTGANGKSTFLETIRALLGDYFTQADFSTFLNTAPDGPRNDIARLAGARMVAAVEAESGNALAEAVVKQVTGGDTITARFLYGEFFDFKPSFKLWLAANHKPVIRGGDLGIWRRIRLVPFTVTIPEAERDPNLPDALRAELPGILAWAVRGCLAWRADGLGVPDEVRLATEGYRAEMDALGDFFAARCILQGDAEVQSKELYAALLSWAEDNGDKPASQKGLGRRLTELGLTAKKGAKGVRFWAGIRLRRDTDPPNAEGGGWQVGGTCSGNSPISEGHSSLHEASQPHISQLEKDAPPSATCHPAAIPDPTDAWEEGEL